MDKDLFVVEFDYNDGFRAEKINITTTNVIIFEMDKNGTFVQDESISLFIDNDNILNLDAEKVKFLSEINASDLNGTIFKSSLSKAYRILILNTKDVYDLDENPFKIHENSSETVPSFSQFISHVKDKGLFANDRRYYIVLDDNGKVYKSDDNNTSQASSLEVGTWVEKSNVVIDSNLTTSMLEINLSQTSTNEARTLLFVSKDSKVFSTRLEKKGDVSGEFLFNKSGMDEFKTFADSIETKHLQIQ